MLTSILFLTCNSVENVMQRTLRALKYYIIITFFRSSGAEVLVGGGPSKSWLLGNSLITITTSGPGGGSKGVCTRCKALQRSLQPHPDNLLSGNEAYQPPRRLSVEKFDEQAGVKEEEKEKEKEVEEEGVETFHLCSCWCRGWAEVKVRRPTGNVAWLMRVQNKLDILATANVGMDLSLATVNMVGVEGVGENEEEEEEEEEEEQEWGFLSAEQPSEEKVEEKEEEREEKVEKIEPQGSSATETSLVDHPFSSLGDPPSVVLPSESKLASLLSIMCGEVLIKCCLHRVARKKVPVEGTGTGCPHLAGSLVAIPGVREDEEAADHCPSVATPSLAHLWRPFHHCSPMMREMSFVALRH